MLETVREPFGELRGAIGVPGAHGPADREQIGGEFGREPVTTPAHERVEPPDGAIEAFHGRGEGAAAGPCGREIDDLSHGFHTEAPL